MNNFSAYIDLIKYKLSLAVVLSAVTGYFISGAGFDTGLFYLASGVFFLATGAASLNQYSERRIDSLMERTKGRPIPSGKISEKKALLISSFLLITGSFLLFQHNLIAGSLGLFNVFLYNIVYTRLKRITVLSIIPGGLVGAIPPMIGYSSAGGSLGSLDIIAFSLFMFLWQVPHFWLIIAKYGDEYRQAGLATISSYLNNKQIRKLVFWWVLISGSSLFIFLFVSDLLNRQYLVPLSVLNICFILLFYHNLFGKKEYIGVKGAMILINSYGLLIMLMWIAGSVFHLF